MDRKFASRIDVLIDLLITKYLTFYHIKLLTVAGNSERKVIDRVKPRVEAARTLMAHVITLDAEQGEYSVQSGAKK